jgi:hypothetical protein
MPLTITVPDEIARAAEAKAAASGTSAESLLLRALESIFAVPPAPISEELREEFDAWEQASDEDMARVEATERL